MFVDLKLLIGDVLALTECTQSKGHAGVRMCVVCRNVLKPDTVAARVVEPDGYLVCSTCTEPERFDRHTSASFRGSLARLEEAAAGAMPAGKFAELEIEHGMKWQPQSWLVDKHLAVSIVDVLSWDWMHVFFIKGVFTREVYRYFMGATKEHHTKRIRNKIFCVSFIV